MTDLELLDGATLPEAMADIIDYLLWGMGGPGEWEHSVHEEDSHCPQVDAGDRDWGEPCKCDGYLVELIIPALLKLARGKKINELERKALQGWRWKE